MSTIPCPDCGHQVSVSAASCPNCGKPTTDPFLKLIAFTVIAGVMVVTAIWWFTSGLPHYTHATTQALHDKVTADAVEQYEIASRQGDPIQMCVQAGIAAAAFLQAKDSDSYDSWKLRQSIDCRKAGIPTPGQ